jgi:signal transduction histidine kinase
MVGILLVSFAIVGFISGYNIIRLNTVKNELSLRERSFSVLVEMQHKYGQAESLRAIDAGEIDNLLIKFANVFFTDINLYNPQGQIIGSSRPQIFDEGLISDRMNAGAYYQLVQEKKSGLIQEEAIGGLSYSSAYLPFYNDRGNLLGYLNLPYFSRQDELKKEVSSFLVTVVNIYVLLVLAGIVIIFFIARYITSPLGVLAGKMARLQLGSANEKIDWKRGDEIGKLVEEYNRMIDELERSAEMLARSEREGAWREMARQVAHEIKNPLTPMKLSIQYLQKAWADKAPDREQRLERFSKILIEQIDTLSSIATEFSDFARMPDPVIEQVDLGEVLLSAISLYKELENIRFSYHSEVQGAIILADRKQMLRAVTNLLNNSVQAIGDSSGGSVSILLSKAGSGYSVRITDNGTGIAAEQANRIFQPNFTTKSGGMGLGLAIVKGIVQNTGGDITFAGSEAGDTTFIITIPGYTGTNLS